MRLFTNPRRTVDERLLWSRDTRFVHRLASFVPGSRVLELDSGAVVIAPASELTELVAHSIAARGACTRSTGSSTVDAELPEADRYLTALSAAVQASGLAERIGMAQTTQVIQTKTLDYFFSLRKLHAVAFQPIVELATGGLHEYECLFRPNMPMLPQSISSIVQAAIDTDRSIELDVFLISTILERAGQVDKRRRANGGKPLRVAVNVTPPSLLDARFEAAAFATMVRDAGLDPRNVTLECTEQQAVADVDRLQKAVKALRRAGFGFAVDDAGAGYASFALIAALRPTVIKIDRDIVAGIARDDAKQALVEAFVSFGRRIGARLLAEGIEKRADLAIVTALGVDLGQGYLLGPTVRGTRAAAQRWRSSGSQAARRVARAAAAHAPLTVPTNPVREAPAPPTDRPAAAARPQPHGSAPSRVPSRCMPTPTTSTTPTPARARARLPRRHPLRDDRHDRPRRRPAPGRHLVPPRRRRDRHQQPRSAGAGRPTSQRDARISVAVSDQADGYRWVGLTGRVTVVDDQPTAQADIAEMARRYHADDPDEAEATHPRPVRAPAAGQLPGADRRRPRPPRRLSGMDRPEPMRFGLQLWSQSTDWPGFRDAALAADAAGWDSVWTWDHLLAIFGPWEQPILEGWSVLAALGPITSRVRLGLMVGANTFRNPGLTAKLATTLDQRLGRARGPGHRRRLVRARARGVRHRLRGEPGRRGSTGSTSRSCCCAGCSTASGSTTAGPRYTFRDAICEPRPIQARLPILIGGSGRRKTLRTVAERADAWNTSGTIEEVRDALEALAGHADAVGRDLATLEKTVSFPIVLRDTAAAAKARMDELLAAQRRGAHGRRPAPGRVARTRSPTRSGRTATSASGRSSCGCRPRTTARRSSASARSPSGSRG